MKKNSRVKGKRRSNDLEEAHTKRILRKLKFHPQGGGLNRKKKEFSERRGPAFKVRT